MLSYLISYIKPVIKKRNGEIVVIIRGLKFQAKTWYDINREIEAKIRFYRIELSIDMNKVGCLLTGSGSYGKWDPNKVILNKNIKNLIVLEEYLKKIRTGLYNCGGNDKAIKGKSISQIWKMLKFYKDSEGYTKADLTFTLWF